MQGKTKQTGFSLVELLVVVAIIALLITIAVPSFSRARDAAKRAASEAMMNSLETGLGLFQAESALGGGYPPSTSSILVDDGYPVIDDPFDVTSGRRDVRITGASLLVYALAGPDGEGTAGFSSSIPNTPWEAITGAGDETDLYASGNTRPIPAPRYGPYVDGAMLDQIRPMRGTNFQGESVGLLDTGIAQDEGSMSGNDLRQLFFVDKFQRPFLYYRARPAARLMVASPNGTPGVYNPLDNGFLTGYSSSAEIGGWGDYGIKPVVFERHSVKRQEARLPVHDLAWSFYPGDNMFARRADSGRKPAARRFDTFIVSESSRTTPRPVNPDTYLLISAGVDGIYGSEDDVVNWSR